MNRGLSTLQSSSAFDGVGAGDFLHSTLRVQEMLTTIRYGVEVRRGIVVITGEPGVGKTTLLYRVAAESSPNVACVVESDPRVSFNEALQLLQSSLGLESSDTAEQVMLRNCQRELRARLEKCQIVALMFDNADHLSEQTLRHMIKNFLGGSAEDPDGALLQLVLAGRPQLKLKLSDAALFPLRRRPPIVCELEPLNNQEIGSYIEHWQRSNLQTEPFFDARVIKRIALYTKGNPRAINAICERVTEVAGLPGGAPVSAELIDEIARDLHLRDNGFVSETPSVDKQFPTFGEIDHGPRFQLAPAEDYTKVLGRTFIDDDGDEELGRAVRPRRRKSSWPSLLLLLIVLGAAGAWIGPEKVHDAVTFWSGMLTETIAQVQKPQTRTSEPEQSIARAESSEPLPAPADMPPPAEPRNQNVNPEAVPAWSETSLESLTRTNRSQESPPSDEDSRPRVSDTKRRAPPQLASNQPRNQDLQLQIIKAIENRAVMGVEVAVIRDMVYLRGHVATERQRRAAERAARSVSDGLQVHNRIVVD